MSIDISLHLFQIVPRVMAMGRGMNLSLTILNNSNGMVYSNFRPDTIWKKYYDSRI